MTTLIELAQHIENLYPLKDKQAGLTELEELGGKPRYVPSQALQDGTLWDASSVQLPAAR
ncbi:hypothetical protein [Pseudomonas sp.]|uniref:hypothetical protein n=1 Tax=Pseudomonas sp. TaxID=306 RepID=UPI0019F506E6|nr:hypothetical protein [Pseudomonas sp.]MBF0675170.1 hypothetical protein [Pseudomonas sp.]